MYENEVHPITVKGFADSVQAFGFAARMGLSDVEAMEFLIQLENSGNLGNVDTYAGELLVYLALGLG